jgi:FlaA1/EpsC-like NDP-sugar epimerase
MKERDSLLRGLEEGVLRLRNRYLLLVDLLTLPLAAYLAFVLRLDALDVGGYLPTALALGGIALLVKIPIFAGLGGYSHYWPFASTSELVLILKTAAVGEVFSIAALIILSSLLDFDLPPRSVPLLDFILSVVAFALPRLGLRMLYDGLSRERGDASARRVKRVFIVGAGEGGCLVLEEIRRNRQLGLRPVGFVDDDPYKQRLNIHGVRVLGSVADIPRLVKEYRIDQVLVALPSAKAETMRRVVDACYRAGVKVLTLPGVYELLSGDVRIQRFRPVQVEDLLSREPVQTDFSRIQQSLTGRRVLVTGAGGSIGSELCRQIARCAPESLILVGHGENSIFLISRELRAAYPDLLVHPLIVDIRDGERLERIFAEHRPQVVFHAAAHKHVPLMEVNPEEAVSNNVGGTRTLLRVSEGNEVSHFVLISTDKAVNPTSFMGATKRIAELLVQATAHRTGRPFVAVRFGNVLGSRGSVVPIFQRQIEAGGPLTVTHPDVRRYFMTIPEAVQLVLQAATLGKGGEIFVLDMGEPVKIVDLARDMIRLAGLRVEEEISIVFTGLRPGEKLFEELFRQEEAYYRTSHEKVFVSANGFHRAIGEAEAVRLLLDAAGEGDREALQRYIQDLVPECRLMLVGEPGMTSVPVLEDRD